MSNGRWSKFSGGRFWQRHRMQTDSCPYNIAHCLVQKRLLNDLLFEKWQKRPNRAYALYWRMHSKEAQAVSDVWKARARTVFATK